MTSPKYREKLNEMMTVWVQDLHYCIYLRGVTFSG